VSFVFADAPSAESARRTLPELGCEVTAHSGRLLDAVVPVDRLAALGGLPGLRLAHRVVPVFAGGPVELQAGGRAVESEGVAASGAAGWHAAGVSGAGVTVGIIGAFAGYGAAVAAGEVPEAFAAGALDVSKPLGTACAEVVHDMAPGAELVLASAETTTEAAAAIDALAALGASVILSPGQYITPDAPPLSGPGREPGDGTGALCQAIAAARADDGVLFVQAGGDLALSHWDGTFTDANRNQYHEFAPGVEVNQIALGAASIATFLRWDDWPESSQDYDLELWLKNGAGVWELVTSSQNEQSGTQPPWEFIERALDPAQQYGLRIKKYGATRNVFLDLTDFSAARLAQTVAARSLADAAACASALAVASVDVLSPTLAVPDESSRGPSYGSGGAAAGGLDQPRLAGYEDVLTATYGSAGFHGSPAAAAHVAAAAALVREREPGFSVDDVQALLEARAVDVEGTPAGYDHAAGMGRLSLGDPGPCTFELAPSSVELTLAGGAGTFAVSTAAGCPWHAVSGAEWVSVTAGAAGVGNGTVAYEVAINEGEARSAAITVGGAAFTVTQGAATCSYELSAAGTAVAAAGGTGSVEVTASLASCAWAASADVEWITVTAGAGGTGSGTVEFAVAANPGGARTGTISIAGLVFTVEQESAPCTFELSAPGIEMPAAGGEASVGVATNLPQCEWTAVANDAWITVTAGASGTGGGTVAFTVAANAGEARAGTLTIAGLTYTVQQAAAPCSFQLGAASFVAAAVGGETDVEVTANLASCAWTAVANDPWIGVAGGSEGTGNGAVHLVIAANLGEARTGTATIAGIVFTVEQAAAPCAYLPDATGARYPAAGGSGSVTITTNRPTCAWTAVSNAAWITVTGGASTTGTGTATYSVAANSGDARIGTITVAEHTFTVEQDPVPCDLTLSAPSQAFAAAGGSGSVGVTANLPSCQWSAVANDAWITVTGGAAGAGNGSVSFSVAANPGAARVGTLTIAGTTFSVLQGAAGCTYSLFSWSSTWGPEGGAGGQTRVYANQPSCTWNAFSNVPWVTITAGHSGTGSELVTFDVAANPGQARQGTLTIAGWTYRVYQDGAPCSFAIAPESAEVGAEGGSGSVAVTASHPSCAWTAVSSAPDWLTVTAGALGTGNGSVSYAVAANTGDIRTAVLVIGGRSFTIQQASPPCTYAIAPTSQAFAAAGGAGSIAVTTNFASCAWTAISNTAWLTVTSGVAGAGPGTVGFAVADNPGEPRTGTLTVAGRTFTVTQDRHGTPVRRGLKGKT
jgi:hypothetical protein